MRPLSPEELAQLEQERAAQGLEPRVSDPGVLAKVARIVAGRSRDAQPARSA